MFRQVSGAALQLFSVLMDTTNSGRVDGIRPLFNINFSFRASAFLTLTGCQLYSASQSELPALEFCHDVAVLL